MWTVLFVPAIWTSNDVREEEGGLMQAQTNLTFYSNMFQATNSEAEKWSQRRSIKHCSSSNGHLELATKAGKFPYTPMLKYPNLEQK